MLIEKKIKILLIVLIIALTGLVYELIGGTVSGYLLGDSILSFSLTIGFFLFGMGIGSLLSKYVKKNLLSFLIYTEIFIAVLGSFLPLLAFWAFSTTPFYSEILLFLLLILGVGIGLEIPVIIRLLTQKEEIRISVANIFSADYVGALLGSIIFPFILLPYLGISDTALTMGTLNLLVAALIYKEKEIKTDKELYSLILASLLITGGFFFQEKIMYNLETSLYEDNVIYSKQTPFQRIVITSWKGDIRLFLNGNLQFSSQDEYRYHEFLVHFPLGALKYPPKKILILGGGDGLAIKQIEKYYNVDSIHLVDLDKQLVELFTKNKLLRELNDDAFHKKNVVVFNMDAMKFLEETNNFYDIIIADLPDPNNVELSKLYSKEFFLLVKHRLSHNGIFITQASSPFFTKNTFWSINNTLNKVFKYTIPAKVYVPSFGVWGFCIASNRKIYSNDVKLPRGLRYLTQEEIKHCLTFPADMLPDSNKIIVNKLTAPNLYKLYINETKKFY